MLFDHCVEFDAVSESNWFSPCPRWMRWICLKWSGILRLRAIGSSRCSKLPTQSIQTQAIDGKVGLSCGGLCCQHLFGWFQHYELFALWRDEVSDSFHFQRWVRFISAKRCDRWLGAIAIGRHKTRWYVLPPIYFWKHRHSKGCRPETLSGTSSSLCNRSIEHDHW